jgi:hypothetical protein
MGMMRAAGIVISLMLMLMMVSFVLSIDVYLVVGAAVMGIVVLGLVAGVIGGVKLSSRIERHVENDNEKAAESLAKDINKAHRSIRIVGGTANPWVYNDEKVKNAFSRAIQRGVKIQVAFSKIESDEENTITELAKGGMIELYEPHSDKVPRNHFRVMDTISVYSEKEHADGDVNRYSERFDNIHNMAIRFEKAFDNIIENSERLYAKNNLSGR